MLKKLLEKYYDIIVYLIFGVLTTLVSWAIYFPLYYWLDLSALSSGIAWVLSVAFAYLTNKPFVFKSHDWSREVVIPELTKFVSCRAGSGLLDVLIMLVAVDWLQGDGKLWKLITSILVVVLNYVGSKLLVFTGKSKEH